MKLYIIGNGFDIHHGFNTRYSDFQKHIENNDIDLANDLERYFFLEVDKNYLWQCFEQDLGHYNHREFFDQYNDIDIMSESFKPSECYGLEDEIIESADELVGRIRSNFEDWLLSIEYPSPDDVSKDLLLDLDPDGLFLNFNYTDTLTELYDISRDRILYIHNNVNEQFGDLIFGHGQKDEDNPEGDELDENGDSNRTMFTDSERASRYPFYALKKDSESIIKDNSDYFKGLKDVSEVVVLGHSYGSVDLPYFKEINKNIKKSKWRMACYSKDDLIRCKSAIEICKIPGDQIEIIKISDLIRR